MRSFDDMKQQTSKKERYHHLEINDETSLERERERDKLEKTTMESKNKMEAAYFFSQIHQNPLSI